jgi:alpha/beta superfamily hydrolase
LNILRSRTDSQKNIVFRVRFLGLQNNFIEGVYSTRDNQEDNPIALIMSPQGKSEIDPLSEWEAYSLFYLFARNGFSVLRFKYSAQLDEEYPKSNNRRTSELIDANYAFQWLYNKHPSAAQIWVAGAGFGAYIAMQMLMRRTNTSGFVALSLPVTSYDLAFLSPCPAPGIIVHGMNNPITPYSEISTFAHNLKQQRDLDIQFVGIPDAGDRFTTEGQKTNVMQSVDQYLSKYYWSGRPQKDNKAYCSKM